MKKRFLWLAVLPVLVLPILASTQTLEEKVKEFELPNGMKFIVIERHVAPVFFGAIVYEVGAVNEWLGVTGISHLLEHMLFKGTTSIGTVDYRKERKYLEREDEIAAEIKDLRSQIRRWRLGIFNEFSRNLIASLDEKKKSEIGGDKIKELEVLIELLKQTKDFPKEAQEYPTLLEEKGTNYFSKYIALKQLELELARVEKEHRKLIIKDEFWDTYRQNGARFLNAFTANDLTAYFVYLPANRLELWMMMESDRMKNAVFREFYSEKNVVMEEKRLGENDPANALWHALLSTAFVASPYGRPVIGWMSDIETITRDELKAYFKRFYAPNNAVAILVGDINLNEVKRLARKYFGRIPAQEPPDPIETVEPEQRGERRVTLEFPANPRLIIAYHIPVPPHPDAYPLMALVEILGNGRTSRLYKKIYEELQLTSEPPDVSQQPGERLSCLLTIEAVPRHPHTAEEVERAIYEEIEAIKETPPTERELERMRNQLDADLVRNLGSNVGIAFNLGMYAAIRGDWRAYLEDIEKMRAVTPEDVSRVARKYLVPQNRTVATLVKVEEKKEAPEEEIDFEAIAQWIQSLPDEEKMRIFQKLQGMTPEERKQFAKELLKKIKANQK